MPAEKRLAPRGGRPTTGLSGNVGGHPRRLQYLRSNVSPTEELIKNVGRASSQTTVLAKQCIPDLSEGTARQFLYLELFFILSK
jgi:hypothetical protein